VARTGMHSVTQYELWKSIWSSLNDRNLFELAWTMKRHNELLATFAPLTFVGNHDVTRIASRLEDPRLLPHALVVLCTLGGTPSVYAGDEWAFTGVKEERIGGDDAIRPEFPPSPDRLPRTGEPTFRLHQELIGLRRRHPWLHRASAEVVHLANERIVYDVSGEGHRSRVLLNLSGSEFRHPCPGATVLAGTTPDGVVVPPYGWAVLDVAS
jgi:cyclomaltodextrinase